MVRSASQRREAGKAPLPDTAAHPPFSCSPLLKLPGEEEKEAAERLVAAAEEARSAREEATRDRKRARDKEILLQCSVCWERVSEELAVTCERCASHNPLTGPSSPHQTFSSLTGPSPLTCPLLSLPLTSVDRYACALCSCSGKCHLSCTTKVQGTTEPHEVGESGESSLCASLERRFSCSKCNEVYVAQFTTYYKYLHLTTSIYY